MSQKPYINNNAKQSPEVHLDSEFESENEDDDSRTLISDKISNAASLNYLRNEGVLEGSTVYDGDSDLLSKSKIQHNRSFSNDRHLKTQLTQLHYNNNRVSLHRSVSSAIQLLSDLKDENLERPIFYPTNGLPNQLLNSRKAHLALLRKNSIRSVKTIQKQIDDEMDESENNNLQVLKLHIKLDNNQISNLDKSAIGQLLDEKIVQVNKHLSSLRERIDDISSKVFVTGDLNSGKSTFCNALLRRRVLPEDQQPCTTVFCEVVDSKENNGLEEVHAVPIDKTYDLKDESTFLAFPLKELEALVGECDKYSILKVYVTDRRSAEESLLKNGVIDVALIDAPGLNMDSYQTTEVFSRQEEIDLVVFVLSAENHFTLSAKEFIAATANEKKLIFIVVNRFDQIKDKNKCMNRILEQVQQLSPDTHKDAREFVHFVSSSGVVDNLPYEDNDGESGDGDNGNGSNDPDLASPDFDHLENSLRNFLLQKRALSKLQPAKTYLSKLFADIENLSLINQKMYINDKDVLVEKLNEINPAYEESILKSVKVNEKIEAIVEKTGQDLYDYTKAKILLTLDLVGNHPIVPYEGLLNISKYTVDTQIAITKNILNSVTESEEHARRQTADAVKRINKLGEESLGDQYNTEKVFREDFMFTRRRDTISRQLNNDVSIFDFFDPTFEGFLSTLGLNKSTADQVLVWKNSIYSVGLFAASRVVTTGNVLKGVVHYGSFFSFNTIRLLAIPITVATGVIGVAYLIRDIPNALSRRLAQKIKVQIEQLDYPHQNSERISKESRKVLKIPAREVQNSFQTSLDKHAIKKDKILNEIKGANAASAVFGKLLKRAADQRSLVESYDLESISQVE